MVFFLFVRVGFFCVQKVKALSSIFFVVKDMPTPYASFRVDNSIALPIDATHSRVAGTGGPSVAFSIEATHSLASVSEKEQRNHSREGV